MAAFSEKSLFEQGMTGSFYATGSNAWIGEEPATFVSALKNKEQIKLSFPVRTKVRMLPNSSSIYYFNFDAYQWNIPSDAVRDHAGPSESFAVDTRYVQSILAAIPLYLNKGISGSIFVEDEKWFDTHGNSLGSGSVNIFRTSSFKDRRQKMNEESFIDSFNLQKDTWSKFLALDLPKSVQRARDYNIKKNEYFTLPIKEPFLIEKVIFEIPFCFGNGWFNDRTLLTLMTASRGDYTFQGTPLTEIGLVGDVIDEIESKSGYANGGATSTYNFGGPGITLALFSEKNYGTGSIRDLVCRSFITHEEDSVRDVRLTRIFDESYSRNELASSWVQVTPLGHDSTITKIDAIVSPSYLGPKKFFTGSIVSTADVEITNGVRIIHERSLRGYFNIDDYYEPLTYDQGLQFISGVLENEYAAFETATLTGIDTFGRGMTGFSPSGGSIFGSEYVSAGLDAIRRDGSIKNISRISEPRKTQLLSEFSDKFTFYYPSYEGYASPDIVVPCYYFIGSRRQSPYLINPGEKLSLAIVKNRPAMINFKADIPNPEDIETGKFNLLSSSFYMELGDELGHDVQLNTGSINITLYGSYVREGRKYIP